MDLLITFLSQCILYAALHTADTPVFIDLTIRLSVSHSQNDIDNQFHLQTFEKYSFDLWEILLLVDLAELGLSMTCPGGEDVPGWGDWKKVQTLCLLCARHVWQHCNILYNTFWRALFRPHLVPSDCVTEESREFHCAVYETFGMCFNFVT